MSVLETAHQQGQAHLNCLVCVPWASAERTQPQKGCARPQSTSAHANSKTGAPPCCHQPHCSCGGLSCTHHGPWKAPLRIPLSPATWGGGCWPLLSDRTGRGIAAGLQLYRELKSSCRYPYRTDMEPQWPGVNLRYNCSIQRSELRELSYYCSFWPLYVDQCGWQLCYSSGHGHHWPSLACAVCSRVIQTAPLSVSSAAHPYSHSHFQ